MPKSHSTLTATTKNDLDPVWIPSIARSISGDTGVDGGVGLWWKNHDLDVLVKLPAGTPPMTFLQLFWDSDSVPVAHAFIGEHNQHLDYVTLTVSPRWILPSWADSVYCRVTRPSGNVERTRPVRLRVKHTQPGGRDPNIDLDGHQGLNFDLPNDVKINGVHPGNVGPGKGVDIVIHPYEHMSLYDTILLAWGSQLIEYRLDKPIEVGNSVIITVDYQTIVKAGDDEMLRVAFQVKDAVGNFPDYFALWSAVEFVNVSLGFKLHDRPWLGQEGDPEDEIHLAILQDDDQSVWMYPSTKAFEIGDSVLMVFDGWDADGMGVPHTELWLVDQLGRSREFFVPNAIVKAVASGTATIFYEHESRLGGGKRQSLRRQVKVIGDRPAWPAPQVDEAPAGYLDPDVNQATVRFTAAPGWQPDYDLSVVMATTHTDNPVHYRATRKVGVIPPDREMIFVIPGAEVRRFKGHAVVAYYELGVPDVTPPRASEHLPLLVGEFVGDMPQAIVEKAEGGWLNPDDVPMGTSVTLPFAEAKAGDEIVLYWAASDEGVSEQFPFPVTADGQTIQIPVPAAYIAPNLGKSVTVYYTLKRGAQPLRFSRILTLYIGILPLSIDPRLMELNGLAFKINWPTTGVDAPGNTGVRSAIGGVPPYTYKSSAETIALVEESGKVTGNANGLSRITVTDVEGTSVEYLVEVSNVYKVMINETPMTSHDAIAWMQSIGGISPYPAGLGVVGNLVYIPPVRFDDTWICLVNGPWHYFLHSGSPIHFNARSGYWLLFPAWCVVLT